MRKTLLFFLVGAVFLWIVSSQGSASWFFALILRDGNYLFNLVTKQNSLDRYAPPDLVDLSQLGVSGKYVRSVAYQPLKRLVLGAREEGVWLKIISAYRSHKQQESVFAYWSKYYEDANKFSAEAGHSEHQLGTTVDFGIGDSRVDFEEAFADTPQGRWLGANAWRYGFVMSYPREKERVSGYMYEPWHFRYIGVEAAREVSESGVTLREYLSAKPQHYLLIRLGNDHRIYRVERDGTKRWISSAETFLSLGYDWEDVALVTREEFALYPEGDLVE